MSATIPNEDDDFATWLRANPAPDLQTLVEKAGRRRAAELREFYDPTNPEHGGYPHITTQEWAEYDAAIPDWQQRRRHRH